MYELIRDYNIKRSCAVIVCVIKSRRIGWEGHAETMRRT
jgi:hypothetical protein